MATRVGLAKIWMTPFDWPTPKTPTLMQNSGIYLLQFVNFLFLLKIVNFVIRSRKTSRSGSRKVSVSSQTNFQTSRSRLHPWPVHNTTKMHCFLTDWWWILLHLPVGFSSFGTKRNCRLTDQLPAPNLQTIRMYALSPNLATPLQWLCDTKTG